MTQKRLTLVEWSPAGRPDLVRLYVNGLPDLGPDDRAWIESFKGKLRAMRKDDGSPRRPDQGILDEVVESLRAHGALASSSAVSFEALRDAAINRSASSGTPAQRPRQTQKGGGPAHDDDWRMRQAAGLDPASIKLAGPVEIVIDHREPDELADIISEHPMARVTRAAMEVGDIGINQRADGAGWEILIERKDCNRAPSDFDRSITQNDRRLFRQVESLSQLEGTLGILLLEGDVFRNSTGMELIQQVDGFLSFCAAIQNVSVIPTLCLRHTGYAALKLAQHQRYGLGYTLGLRPPKPKRQLETARFVIEGLPGVNAELARVLLERFGTVQKVMCASAEELMRVPGIGPKRAQLIVNCVTGNA